MPRRVPKLFGLLFVLLIAIAPAWSDDLHDTIRQAQQKVVKIYGAGGLRQMEAYQSGILVSSEGHVLTVLSYVLDTDELAVVLDDGRRYQAERVGTDPLRDLALLKLPLEPDDAVPFFDLKQQPKVQIGDRVLALSNLYGIATGDEPVSALQGTLTAIAPLDARRGAFAMNYHENVYVVDAYANNPGAAGGALVNWQGELLGLLGKELKSRVTGTWLNYAVPTSNLQPSVEAMIAGRTFENDVATIPTEESLNAELLGIRLIPNVLRTTPPYVDSVRRGSPAEVAGLRPDDLIVFVAGKQIASRRALVEELALHDQREEVPIVVLRDGGIVETTLQLVEAANSQTTNGTDDAAIDVGEEPTRSEP